MQSSTHPAMLDEFNRYPSVALSVWLLIRNMLNQKDKNRILMATESTEGHGKIKLKKIYKSGQK
jgi:hypothetical protein